MADTWDIQSLRCAYPCRMWLFTTLNDEVVKFDGGLRIALKLGASVREQRRKVFNKSFVSSECGLDVAE